MNSIGFIDDKDRSRRAFMLKLKLQLESQYPNWKIIDSKPFKELERYRQWILENEISVLIIDERLDEEKLDDGSYVKYFGSDLVKKIREYFKDIPIYCITNIEITPRLRDSLYYFNLILSKAKFDSDIDNYLNMIIKSGLSFYSEFQAELSRLGQLSEKIAEGNATPKDLEETQALQTKLVIPHFSDELLSREKNLVEIENIILELKTHQENLIKYLNEK